MPDSQRIANPFKPAKREGVGLFIGLASGTGGGKTYSAQRLARGIVGPTGRIAAIDTEGKRMSHYTDRFKFDAFDMPPPFRPERFEELAKAAEANGYGCLIIDSFSHEWAGDGGVLEWHDEIAGGDEKRNMMGWIKPKAAHKAMINSFLQRTIPIIFCMRAEEKVKVAAGGKPVPQGWMPICDPRFQYELTTLITMSNENPGKVDYRLPRKISEHHLHLFPDGAHITEEAGAKLAAWARGDDIGPKVEAPKPPTDKTTGIVDALIGRMAEATTSAAVEAIHDEDIVKKQVAWMKDHRRDQFDRLMKATDERNAALVQGPPDEPPQPDLPMEDRKTDAGEDTLPS